MENDKAEFAQGQSTTSQDESENEKVDDSPDRAIESLLVDTASRIIGRPGSQITTDNSDAVLSQNLERISTERASGSGMALLRDGFVRITIPENINKVSSTGNVNQPSTRMPVRKDYRNSIIPEEPPEGSIAESDESFIRMYYGISEDPEHGVSSSGAKTSSTRDNSYHLRPMVTVIDINSDGKAQMLTRSTATAFKPQRRDVSNGCVRLILKHVTDTKESRVTNFLKTPANQDIIKELGTGTFEQIALNLKRRRFSDIMMPGLKVVGLVNSLMLDRRYSVRQLHGLFLGPNKVNSSQRFVVKTNLHVTYFPRNTRKPEWEDGYVMVSGPEAIYNGPASMTTRYWWMFAESEIKWLKANTADQHRAAIVTCYFPSLPIRSTVETQDQETLLPLQKKFEDILNSEEGALRFHNKNIQTTCKLLILDLLRSCMENWWDFFIDIESSPIIPRIERTSLAELLNNSASYGFFSSQIRDMNACFSYLLESLEFDFNLDADKEKFKRWKRFRFEIESLYQSLSNKSDDYLKRSEFTLQSFQAMVNQKQAESSTGLTVIAAIFLPLGLASSLLSMSENASQVGSKWYDWIGLWFVIGLFCVAGYTLWRIICVVKGSQYGRYVRRLLQLSQFMKLWLYFPFLAVIGASFLAGMFGTKHLAASILKIGVPSTIALSILILMLRWARWSRKVVALRNKMKRQVWGR